jgi:cell division transport system permease protein
LFATLGSISRTPVASTSIVLIIAITLLLPMLLYVTLKGGQQLSASWQGQPQISVFLQMDLDNAEAQLIFEELRLHPAIRLAEFISPEQALDEFRILSGLEQELDFLDENPLPASVVVMPHDGHAQSVKLLALQDELVKIDGIESIRLDLDWTDRFNALLDVGKRLSIMLSALLLFGLILIVSNTIKLLIVNRRQEIEVTKLVGGSNSFVRRPFLYYGLLFGFIGAVFAIVLLIAIANYLAQPIDRLADLYNTQALIYQLKATEILAILGFGGFIGWIAARWSVAQHLRHIKPR